MRVASQSVIYPSLTDRERYRGTDARFEPNGLVVLSDNGNTIKTPRIQKLLNEKNNENIPVLKFDKGVLNISNGASYRVPTRFHGLQAFSFHTDGFSSWKAAYDMPEQDFSHFISREEYDDIYTTNTLLTAFKANTLDSFLSKITVFNPKTSPANELKRLGAPTGEFIKISKYEEEFMIDYDDLIFTKEDIKNLREGYNRRNCREFNHPPGTIYRIEGKDYVVDENWRLSIPEGVICTPARTEIIKPTSHEA